MFLYSPGLVATYLFPVFLPQVLNVGLEWAGFPALAFYMHSLLAQLHLPVGGLFLSVQGGGSMCRRR